MKILTNLDLVKNQLVNCVIQKVETDPTTKLAEGWIIFNTTEAKLKYYNGEEWVAIDSGGGIPIAIEITESSTNDEASGAKAVYDFVTGNIFSLKFDMDYLKEYIERTITSIDIPYGITSIGVGAFTRCTSLASITIPNSVTSIGSKAFYSCAFTSITIPSSVTSIGDNAFYYCENLSSITISNGVKSIGVGAFQDCSALTSITIPSSVTSIGKNAFSRCPALQSITIDKPPYSISGYPWGATHATIKWNEE